MLVLKVESLIYSPVLDLKKNLIQKSENFSQIWENSSECISRRNQEIFILLNSAKTESPLYQT